MRIAGEPFGTLVWDTIAHPAEASRIVLSERLDRGTLWSALALVSVLSTLVTALRNVLMPPGAADARLPDGQTVQVVLTPFAFAFIIFALLTILVFVLDLVGRVLGGRGELTGILTAVVWTQIVFLIVDLSLLVVMVMVPPLSSVAALVALVLITRASVHFLKVAHDFETLGRAAATLLLSLLGLFIGMGLIIGLITTAAAAFGGSP